MDSISESYDDSFMSVRRSQYHKKQTVSELRRGPAKGPETSEWSESADESFLDVDRKHWQSERYVSEADIARRKKHKTKTETAEFSEAMDDSYIEVERKQWESRRDVSELSRTKKKRGPHITELSTKQDELTQEEVIISKQEKVDEKRFDTQASVISESATPERPEIYERRKKPKKEEPFMRRQYVSELPDEEPQRFVVEEPEQFYERLRAPKKEEPFVKRQYVSELPEEEVKEPLVSFPQEKPVQVEVLEIVEEEITIEKKPKEKPKKPKKIKEVPQELPETPVTVAARTEHRVQEMSVTVESIELKPIEFKIRQKPKRKVSFASTPEEIPERTVLETETKQTEETVVEEIRKPVPRIGHEFVPEYVAEELFTHQAPSKGKPRLEPMRAVVVEETTPTVETSEVEQVSVAKEHRARKSFTYETPLRVEQQIPPEGHLEMRPSVVPRPQEVQFDIVKRTHVTTQDVRTYHTTETLRTESFQSTQAKFSVSEQTPLQVKFQFLNYIIKTPLTELINAVSHPSPIRATNSFPPAQRTR